MRAVSIACLAAALCLTGAPTLTGQGPAVINAFAMRFTPEPVSDVAALPIVLRRPLSLRLERVTVGQALRAITARAGLDLSYSRAVVPLERIVAVAVDGAPVAEALRQVLRDVPVELWVSTTGKMALVPVAAEAASGTVTGRVTDARTGQAVPGARVSLAGTSLGAVTNDSGAFRIANVPPGSYTVTARRIGYVQGTSSITVVADQDVAVDVRLEVSASPLDAVVVTGTVSAAEQKELPSPITVVTAKQIEERGITKINDLFRGDIPGVFTADYGASSRYYGAPVYVRGTTQLVDAPALKTYVDGVEIANSKYLNEIDPAMIDHIEIIRGPEASTLYGAQALNGVMQVFTKRGALASPPHLTTSITAGSMEGQYATGVRHEDNLTVSGGTGAMSYNAGASYEHEGAWTPGRFFDTYRGYGTVSIRPPHSPFDIDLSARGGWGRGRSGGSEAVARAVMDGTLSPQAANYAVPLDVRYTLPQRSVGLTAHYTPRPSWQNTLTLGVDRGSDGHESVGAPSFAGPGDSVGSVFSSRSTRTSAAYNSALDLHLADRATANLIIGADYWDYRHTGGSGRPGAVTLTHRNDNNAGVFSQMRLGVMDALFFTAGVRVDRSSDLPEDRSHRSTSPRVGLSYVFSAGTLGGKLRAGYGSAMKPADPSFKEFNQFAPDYIQLASPNLLPTRQTGWDAGLELYAGDGASLVVTRYRQLARDMIIDTYQFSDTLTTLQYRNVARARNSGWELEGMVRIRGGLSAKLTYSIVESLVDSLAPDDQTGYTVGQDLPGVPHHTGALTLTERLPRLSIQAAVSYVGTSMNLEQGNTWGRIFPRLGAPDFGGAYAWYTLPATYRLGARVTYELTPRITLLARGENLTNRLVYDQGLIPTDQLGRTTLFGLRLR